MLRRTLGPACILAVAISAGTTSPAAADEVVERIPGRVVAGNTVDSRTTRFDELWALNFPAGAAVRVSCEGPRCPSRPLEVGVPSSGLINLAALLPNRRFRASAILTVRVTVDGVGYKETRYRLRRRALPRVKRACQFAVALPGRSSTDCHASCPAPQGEDESYCRGAGRIVAPTEEPIVYSALAGPRIIRFTSLRVRDARPATTVGLFCYGQCPFGARLVFSRRGGTIHLDHVRRLRLPRPMRLEIVLYNANFTASVLRIRAGRHGFLTSTRLCLPPTETQPRRCA